MPQPHEKDWKEWTVMFYFASDNPLAPSIVSQLKALKDAGFHPEANVVAHFDPHTPEMQTHVFDVNHLEKLRALGGSQFGRANDPSVGNLVLDKVWTNTDKDVSIRRNISLLVSEPLRKSLGGMINGNGAGGNGSHGGGSAESAAAAAAPAVLSEVLERHGRADFGLPVLDEAEGLVAEAHPAVSLKNFLLFCKKAYPAHRYILFLLGHGLVVGNRMFMLDEHAAPRRPASATRGGGKATKAETTPATADEELDVSGSLTLKDLSDALDAFNSRAPGADKAEEGKPEARRLELIGFHSCSMSGVEVAYQLQGKANYMMASQGPAFVGSWPYRQILLQLFNSLDASLGVKDLTDAPALISRLRDGADPISKYIRGVLPGTVNAQLALHDASREPDEKTLKALARGLRKVQNDRGLCDADGVGAIEMSGATRRLLARSGSLNGPNRRRLNRLLLADAFPGAITPKPETGASHVRELFKKKFFYSVLYNSADFELAGYSFDLCLCDLNNVGRLGERVDELAGALRAGLEGGLGLADDAVPLARELILLAHWDAQGFWQDTYTDLYDFCFRLWRRCRQVLSWKDSPPPAGSKQFEVLDGIVKACEGVMKVLGSGSEERAKSDPAGEAERVVVRAEFAGAGYQYTHGLSIYFPWSRPAGTFFEKKYKKDYRFGRETKWHEFLDEYFEKTRRESSGQERQKMREAEGLPPAPLPSEPTGELLSGQQARTAAEILETLLPRINARVSADGQLAKGAGNDATGKGAGNDASGDDCDCPSVKNYPPFTGAPDAAGAHSPNFYEQAGVISSPKSSS
jgi:hypothetical protein